MFRGWSDEEDPREEKEKSTQEGRRQARRHLVPTAKGRASQGEGSDQGQKPLRGRGRRGGRMMTGSGNVALTGRRDRCGWENSSAGKHSRKWETERG